MLSEIKERFLQARSIWWPKADGTVVDASVEFEDEEQTEVRVSVVYTFSVGEDGPYSGESYWWPMFTLRRTKAAEDMMRKLMENVPVVVRYKPRNPSVNCLDRSAWRT